MLWPDIIVGILPAPTTPRLASPCLTVSSNRPTPPSPCFAAVHLRIPSFVDYVSFCGAVEPKTGGRDLDNQRRVLDKAWKTKPKESRSGGIPRPRSLEAGSPDSGDRNEGRERTELVRIHRSHSPPPPPPSSPPSIPIRLSFFVFGLCGAVSSEIPLLSLSLSPTRRSVAKQQCFPPGPRWPASSRSPTPQGGPGSWTTGKGSS